MTGEVILTDSFIMYANIIFLVCLAVSMLLAFVIGHSCGLKLASKKKEEEKSSALKGEALDPHVSQAAEDESLE